VVISKGHILLAPKEPDKMIKNYLFMKPKNKNKKGHARECF